MVCIRRFVLALGASVGLAMSGPVFAIEVAEELLVDLDAADVSAGGPVWTNNGTLGDFSEVGDPFVVDIGGAPAVQFSGAEAYVGAELAPATLVGPDPTRSIEVWVYNEVIPGEETLLSWGRRGGGDGTNMSFNYGTSPDFGAVGHWGAPDLGWGTIPTAAAWHHLAYTYDGEMTRVYADGVETNSEFLGNGVVNTHADTSIAIASQWEADAVTLTAGLRGDLAIGRVRVHAGVLTPEQIQMNFVEESGAFLSPPAILNAPPADAVSSLETAYERVLTITGTPPLDVTAAEPDGATITDNGDGTYTYHYVLPVPQPASFQVVVIAENASGDVEALWDVTVVEVVEGEISVAGELIVNLDAADASAGGPVWINDGEDGGDFIESGDPIRETIAGVPAVTFDGVNDYYQSEFPAPAGLVGPDPTRTIEAWVFNPEIASEETIMSWGHRGGGDGTNMSFNYGTHGTYGAVGHWGAPDIGWDDAGGAPAPSSWHHLVYTYDGQTTRVYADGVESNSEFLGLGIINTYADTLMTLAAQIEPDAVTVTPGLRGSLSLGRVRVHEEALAPFAVAHNYEVERSFFESGGEAPQIEAPSADTVVRGSLQYNGLVTVTGIPQPAVTIVQPAAGAEILQASGGASILRYTIADPGAQASFDVELSADNGVGAPVTASWTVTVVEPTAVEGLAIGGELFVNLDASDASAGTASWSNAGTLGDFLEVGDPVVAEVEGVTAVLFNATDIQDAYECESATPAGLVGPDPTRTIEAWVLNDAVADEETILSWGRRGGPDGSNMSFNYGLNANFGAVGHWNLNFQDIGWTDFGAAPEAAVWHHLAYTYDGTTTRVYADGVESNSEELGAGAVNTHADPSILLAAQWEPDGINLNFALRGTLSIARVRIHDEALSAEEIQQNYDAEKSDFPTPEPPVPEPIPAGPIHRYSFEADASDSVGGADGDPIGLVDFVGGEAVLLNDGTQTSDLGNAYIDLPNGIISLLDAATFETWVTWGGPADSQWQRIFDFGLSVGGEDVSDDGTGQAYTFLTPLSGAGSLRSAYSDGVTEQQVNGPSLSLEPNQHIVVTWETGGDFGLGVTVTLYVNGQRVSRDVNAQLFLSQIIDSNNWLGRSQFGPDPLFNGSYNEFRIYDYALTANQVLGNLEAGPDTVNTGVGEPIFKRGDVNASEGINLTDGVYKLNFLFLGGPEPPCFDAADANDDGALNITGAVYIFNFLFLGGPPPLPPGKDVCGADPSDDPLDCANYDNC